MCDVIKTAKSSFLASQRNKYHARRLSKYFDSTPKGCEHMLRLMQGGAKILGSGKYSVVLGDDKFAYKFLIRTEDGWVTYINTFRRSTNPSVPRVYYMQEREGYVFARMELLKPVRANSRYDNFARKVSYFDRDYKNSPLYGEQKGFVRLMHSVNERFGSIDYHAGNVMLRGSTLVLTDPVC